VIQRCLFQSTPLREGRQISSTSAFPLNKFQSTPLREGRLEIAGHTYQHLIVSIHAPARGATLLRLGLNVPVLVSIHAPARGATPPAEDYCGLVQFQSTPLREGRHEVSSIMLSPGAVSIHAPARGATCALVDEHGIGLVSIHAPARGATFLLQLDGIGCTVSIHAPARGATWYVRLWRYLFGCFNPRPCARGDTSLWCLPPRSVRFNPRPCARGDTEVTE